MMGNFGGYGTLGWIGMIIGLVLTVAVIVGAIVLIVWAVKRTSGATTSGAIQNPDAPSAKDIAQARYARGEINRDEYQRILSDLGH